MANALEQGIPFDPMRFREEIKSVEQSIARLEMLLKQYRTCFGLKGFKELPKKIRNEAIFLENTWKGLEEKLKEVEGIEMPYYFIRKQTKVKAGKLLQEAFEIANN